MLRNVRWVDDAEQSLEQTVQNLYLFFLQGEGGILAVVVIQPNKPNWPLVKTGKGYAEVSKHKEMWQTNR